MPSWLRVALEFRHPSWHREDITLLAEHGAAYCVMSGAGLPCVLRATAPSPTSAPWSRPAPPLRRLLLRRRPALVGARVREWEGQGRDVTYFNDGEGNAVRNAETLRRLLGE